MEQKAARSASLQFSDNEDSSPWIRLFDDASGRAFYVGRVSGAQLANLYTQHKSALFTLNIRNYIGDNLTNKTIRKTALESSADFFYFNNGISALAKRIHEDSSDSSGRTLRCEDLSIVNGAQTVRSLHKAQIDDPASVRDVQVLVRLTEVDTKKSQAEQEFLDNVTKYNNTQNSIRISDFRSNDKVQYDIKKRFDSLPALEGKKFLYKNKRSGESARDRIVINMEDFTKTLYAFLYGPDDVYGGTGHVFDATKEGGYVKLFGSHGQLVPSLSNDSFELYAGIWFLCTYAKDLWREEAEKKDPAHERRWMFYFALGEALRACYASEERALNDDIRNLSNPSWLKKPLSDLPKTAIARCARLAFKALRDAYKEAAGKPTFTHRNWFRAQSTLDTVMAQIASSWELLSEHAADYRLRRT